MEEYGKRTHRWQGAVRPSAGLQRGIGSITPRATFLPYEAGFPGGVRVAAGVYPVAQVVVSAATIGVLPTLGDLNGHE